MKKITWKVRGVKCIHYLFQLLDIARNHTSLTIRNKNNDLNLEVKKEINCSLVLARSSHRNIPSGVINPTVNTEHSNEFNNNLFALLSSQKQA